MKEGTKAILLGVILIALILLASHLDYKWNVKPEIDKQTEKRK
ncbi:hypothetical protein [Dysgonomonas sp. 520]|nr:hypothetical protein [Dysgonomonas sp. 520]